MRLIKTLIAATALIASVGTAFGVNPPNDTANNLVLRSTLGALAGRNSVITEPVTDVEPGQTLTITGDCIMQASRASGLEIVLALAKEQGAAQPGYSALVATDYAIRGSHVEVRVPNLPEAANHVFQVKVFSLGTPEPEICNAGAIRIGGGNSGKVG